MVPGRTLSEWQPRRNGSVAVMAASVHDAGVEEADCMYLSQ